MLNLVFRVICAALFLSGCIADIFSRSAGFDTRPITVQTLSFFNQRIASRLVKRSWRGDWVFRRDRLELIDQGLRAGKPDLLLIQEMMERQGSRSESDTRILEAGVLADYEWKKFKTAEYEDTKENQYVAMSIALPLRFTELELKNKKEDWPEYFPLGRDGYVMFATIDYEDQPLTVANVNLPQLTDETNWFQLIEDRALARMKKYHSCPKRLVVGGYIPGDITARNYKNFVDNLQLIDTASGFCQVESKCFTATPINELFMATVGDESPARVDRIFAHRTAFVAVSARNFEQTEAKTGYAKDFGLSRLWATQRFGWYTSLRLPRCNRDELL